MGCPRSDVFASTEPMAELLGRKISYPITFEIDEGRSLDDLRSFGEKLSQGTYHFGVIWGLELGWLRSKFPDLQPLAIPYYGPNAWDCQLMVRREVAAKMENQPLKVLKGSRLVHFQREPMMYQISLEKLFQQEGVDLKDFFQVVDKKYSTAKEALMAVKNGEGDCIFVDVGQFRSVEACFPKLGQDLVRLRHGPSLPAPVIAGRRENLDILHPRLWNDCQQELLTIHETEEGKQCVIFWHFQRFDKPDEVFQHLVARSVRDFRLESRFYVREER